MKLKQLIKYQWSCVMVKVFALVIFLLACSQVFAQGGKTIQEENGEKYYVHEVEQGHTLYAISKLYKVEIDEIIAQNPDVKEGLKIGQLIKIRIPDDANVDRWENPVRIEDGHLIHRVKRRETLFGISQHYNVDINDLLELNPLLNEGLKKNQEIRIPRNPQVEDKESVEVRPAEGDALKRHEVQPNETLYSISKRYNVSMEAIQRANNGLKEGLKAGETILIPDAAKRDSSETVINPETKIELDLGDIKVYPDRFKIALLMPFYLQYLDSADIPAREARLQEIALSFYRGVTLGADSLKKWGLNAEIVVEDVNDNLKSIHSRLNKDDLDDADLVIGPLQREAIGVVSEYYHDKPSHIVIPVPQPNRILLQSENLSEVVPSDVTQMREMAKVIALKHSKDNIILINGGKPENTKMYEVLASTLRQTLSSDSILAIGEIKELRANGKSLSGLINKLNPVRRNVIVAPCTDKAIIADLIRRAGSVDEDDYKIVIYGTSEWVGYDFFDYPARNRFNLHVPAYSLINFESPETISFIKSFRERYKTEPDEYAFLGYDIFQFYGQGLLKFGRKFPNHFDELSESSLISTGFDYYKTGVESGFENRHVYILEYEDNQLKIEGY